MTNAPQHIIDLLEEGLQMTRMKTASFAETKHGMGNDEYSEKVRETTALYRETWVETPLAVVLAYLKGDITAAQSERLWEGDHYGALDEDIHNPKILLGLEKRPEEA